VIIPEKEEPNQSIKEFDVKKLFVLMFVVMTVLGFAGSPTTAKPAEASTVCDFTKEDFDVMGETTVAASLAFWGTFCYEPGSSTGLLLDTHADTYKPTPHPRWDDGTFTYWFGNCGYGCVEEFARVKFTRTTVEIDPSTGYPYPRQPVCALYRARGITGGELVITVVNAKYLC
jgi:hypothetical protein